MKTMKNPHYREVENLLRLGSQRLRQEQLSEALDCFQRAYRQAIKLADAAVIRSCAFNLGACMVTIGEYERAVRYLQLVLPSDAAEKPVPYVGDVYFNIGVAQERLEQGDAANEAFRHAYVHYKKNEKYQLQVEVAFRIARYSESQANIQEARAYYQAAMEACQGDPTLTEWRLRSLVKFAYCSCVLGDFGPAATLAESLSEAHLIPSSDCRVAVLNEMGITLMYANKYEAARDCFQAGLQSVTSAAAVKANGEARRDPLFQRAAFRQNIASALTALNKFEEAIGNYEDAMKLFDASENSNSLGKGHCFLNAALCHARLSGLEHRTAANQLYEKALQCAREAEDRTTQWQALEAMGAIAYTDGDVNAAEEKFSASLALLTQSDSVHRQRIEAKLLQARAVSDRRSARASTGQGTPERVRPTDISKQLLLEDMAASIAAGNLKLTTLEDSFLYGPPHTTAHGASSIDSFGSDSNDFSTATAKLLADLEGASDQSNENQQQQQQPPPPPLPPQSPGKSSQGTPRRVVVHSAMHEDVHGSYELDSGVNGSFGTADGAGAPSSSRQDSEQNNHQSPPVPAASNADGNQSTSSIYTSNSSSSSSSERAISGPTPVEVSNIEQQQQQQQLTRRPKSPNQSDEMRRPSLTIAPLEENKQVASKDDAPPAAAAGANGEAAASSGKRRGSDSSCSSCSSYTSSSYTSYASSSSASVRNLDALRNTNAGDKSKSNGQQQQQQQQQQHSGSAAGGVANGESGNTRREISDEGQI